MDTIDKAKPPVFHRGKKRVLFISSCLSKAPTCDMQIYLKWENLNGGCYYKGLHGPQYWTRGQHREAAALLSMGARFMPRC